MSEKEFTKKLAWACRKTKETKKEEQVNDWQLVIKCHEWDLKVECCMNEAGSFAWFMVDCWIRLWKEILESHWLSYETRNRVLWKWSRYIAKYVMWDKEFSELWAEYEDVLNDNDYEEWEDQE